MFFARDNGEADACREGHCILERTCDKMLRQKMGVEEAERQRDDDAIGSAEDEAGIGREKSGCEGGVWREEAERRHCV